MAQRLADVQEDMFIFMSIKASSLSVEIKHGN